MQRPDTTIIGAGTLLLVASGVLLYAELGPELGIPVEFAAAPIIAGAVLAIVIRNARRLHPV